jgi:hypothetical protein
MASLLHQWYLVLSLVISNANEDWFPFACYADVFFLEYGKPCFVNTKTVPPSDVLSMHIRDVGKSWDVSACLGHANIF